MGVGTIFLTAAPFLPLGQLPPEKECAIISTMVPNTAKTPAPSATAARSVMRITPPTNVMPPREKLEARLIKSPQTAEVLQSYKPHTPTNVPLLHDLLNSHPNQDFVNNLCTGLWFGFWVVYKGDGFSRVSSNLPSTTQQPKVIEANLLEEVQLGQVAGPFESLPFKKFQIHPLGLVPKKNGQ